MLSTSLSLLDKNLAALARSSPAAVRAIREATPRDDLQWVQTPEGVPSAVISEFTLAGLMHRALASKRSPLTEARRLTEKVDLARNAVVVVQGFGVGWHVAELARRMLRSGVIIVYEPDEALLRCVLEHVDHSAWLEQSNVILLTGRPEEAELAAITTPIEGILAMGVHVLEHPPSMPRIAEQAKAFSLTLGKIMLSVRTSVATTLVQTAATLKNLTQNADHYALGPGIADLKDACAGHAAIVVSAGPSLRRNLHLLKTPGVMDKVVVIATQTVLKPLLREGIRPHFVCALDFHEISRRFYEGLTPDDVRGITLVVEPKVNPAVTSAFPGVIRCAADAWLDEVIGPDLRRQMGSITPGATVAHLCYAFARHLGCDPAILIGQDLGFTDGQYYAAGAAIHDVWACELNEFNTLESLEWQRIARHRNSLTRRTDVLGRPIYCDEQMEAYLHQFQRDFMADEAKGLTTIDSTEGGVAKSHTRIMTLSEALKRHAGSRTLPHALREPPAPLRDADARKRALIERLETLARDTARVERCSQDARSLLEKMLAKRDDVAAVNDLIARVQRIADDVRRIEPAYSMVHRLNQSGSLKRTRTDRAIHLDADNDPVAVQRKQITRDKANVESLIESSQMLRDMLTDAARAVRTGAKRTRDPLAPTAQITGDDTPTEKKTVLAVVTHRTDCNGLGLPTGSSPVTIASSPALRRTLERLLRSREADRVCIVTRDLAAARSQAGPLASDKRVSFRVIDREPGRYAPAVLRAHRLVAPHSWRGGIGNFTAYDELIDPDILAATLDEARADAAIIVGSDWCFVDPSLCDEVIRRYREDPIANRLAFTQAAPGLAGCIIDATLARQLHRTSASAGVHASIGGMLSYVPVVPLADLIAKSVCVNIPAAVRDAERRIIADDQTAADRLAAACAAAGIDPSAADAESLSRAVSAFETSADHAAPAPLHLTLNLADDHAGAIIPFDQADALIRQFIASGGHVLTLRDPLLANPATFQLLSQARTLGVPCLHLRSTWSTPGADPTRLRAADGSLLADIVSIDLVADSADLFDKLLPAAGPEGFQRSRLNLRVLTDMRASQTSQPDGGILAPAIVPRITRRDEVYNQVEHVVDGCIMLAGWCVLDPLDKPIPGARIEPLPLPALARRRRKRESLTLTALDAATRRDLAALWADAQRADA